MTMTYTDEQERQYNALQEELSASYAQTQEELRVRGLQDDEFIQRCFREKYAMLGMKFEKPVSGLTHTSQEQCNASRKK